MVTKTKFLGISVLVSEIATFLTKKRSSLWISQKMLQNNTKALFISMWLTIWRKTVFVNIYPLLLVWSKKIFKQIQIFLRICPISKMVRKTNFQSISMIFLRVSLLCSNMWLTLWRKTVFVNIYHILLIWSKTVV